MRRISLLATAVAAMMATGGLLPSTSGAAGCMPTGFIRDGMDLTAAQIGGNVTGTLDATGCNIGVYYDNAHLPGNVTGANIFGANYYGVVVNGDAGSMTVNVTNSQIHDIGEHPLNGTQHGNAIYYRAFGGTASGTISGNAIWTYQKNGITLNGAVSATVSDNTVAGEGPVDYIAQNGIQLGYGAAGSVTGNIVTGNAYTGLNSASSGGILVVGGSFFGPDLAYTTNLDIERNVLAGNDVGVWLANINGAGQAPSTNTNNTVKFNRIVNNAITNITGFSFGCGYQAGIADVGHKDLLVNNDISGMGYANQDCGTAFLRRVDTDSSARGVPSNK